MKNIAVAKFIKLYKTILLFISCLWFSGSSDALAQNNFAVLDTNFVSWLNSNIPAAMSSKNLLDTASTSVKARTSIDISNSDIADLSGIQYFTSLKYLDCSSNKLTALPALSRTLDTLNCGDNYLTVLPDLPNSLMFLDCRQNHLTALPELPKELDLLICGFNPFTSLPALPNSIKILSFEENHFTSLPDLPGSLVFLKCAVTPITSLPSLPKSLKILICSSNLLTSLPALPDSMTSLHCENNQLTNIPALPGNLDTLDCSGNSLTKLPDLPDSLLYLTCQQNELKSLPALPNRLSVLVCGFNPFTNLPALPNSITTLSFEENHFTSLPALPGSLTFFECVSMHLTSLPALPDSLTTLNCSNNMLTSLPALPQGLTSLHCENNQLKSLPALPNRLTELDCSINNISCFPLFPNTLTSHTSLKISNNPYNCLPNYISAMSEDEYILCLPGNPDACAVSKGIAGFTYKDINNNCVKDNGDQNLLNIPMEIYDTNNKLLSRTYTTTDGYYNFSDTAGIYSIEVDTLGMPYMMQCPYPGLDSTIILTSFASNVNFSLICKPGFDVGVQSVVPSGLIYPGQPHSLSIIAGDMSRWYNLNCASGVSGIVQITVIGPVIYAGPGFGSLTPLVSGNVYSYTISDFASINNNMAFNLLFITDVSGQPDDSICVDVTVTPVNDNNVSNNTFKYCYSIAY